jgi:predicted ATPase/DNA-binding SARP family transcriptional activator
MGLKMLTLGGVSLSFNEQSLDAQFGLKARALLLYTALQPHAVSRERLAAMFWKDFPQERASGNLRMTLMTLRERLGESAHITRTDVEIMGWSDMRTFQETLESLAPFMSGAHPCTEEHLQQFEETLKLYKGSFLHNFSVPDAEQFELWAHATREALQRQFFKAAEVLMCHYEEMGRYAEELEWSSYLLKIDPLHEPAYRSLMRLYVSRGERVLALREFETCKRLLAIELNVEPDQETLQLYEQIVDGTFQAGGSAKSAPSVVVTPKRLTPHNLPGQLTPLIGRTEELSDLTRLFEEARLVTVVGTGGIGKTRMAVEFGSQMLAQARYPDGLYFVDLSSIQYPSQVTEAVASVLEIPEAPQLSLSAQIMRHIKNKCLLLILDNFEHVLDASDQLEEWLKASPQLAILVTSREPLQLYAEYLYPVPSLPVTDAWMLFTKRVNAVRSGFTMTKENAPAIQAICARLEGLPLAIELAASHAQALSLDQIIQGLDDSMTFLKSQRRGGLERQRTMYGAIEWSYQLLTAAEQALYRLVSVFVGGWALDAVEALGGELAVHLPALVTKHLVQTDPANPQRFRMLESIREHARHKLADHNEEFLFGEAHLYYFADLSENGSHGLRTNNQEHWFHRLEPERDNFRAALLFAEPLDELSESFCRLVAGLGYFYYVRGYTRETRQWIDKALAKQEDLPRSLRADLLAGAGHITHACAEYALADEYHKGALSHYLALEDWANAAFIMSAISVRERDEERGLSLVEEAYQFAQQTDDDFVLLNAANNYAVSLERLGHLEQARHILESVVEAGTHLKNATLRPFVILNLAGIYRDTGQIDRAAPMFDEIVNFMRQSYVEIAFPHVLEEVGDFYYLTKQIDRAAAHYDEGLRVAEALDSDIMIRRLYRAKALIAAEHKNLAEVKRCYQMAFNGAMDSLVTEDWHSFILAVFHIAEILAARQQLQTSALLLGAMAHHMANHKTRLTAVHLYLQERCFKQLHCYWSEDQIQEAIGAGKTISEKEMFAHALAALEILP